MSDVQVSYDGVGGGIDVLETTTPTFPVVAAGAEIVVRGKMSSLISRRNLIDTATTNVTVTERTLKTIVVANSAAGPQEWSIDHVVTTPGGGSSTSGSSSSSDCRQSYAQARIVELLTYRDAERALGDELFFDDVVMATSRSTTNLNESPSTTMLFEEEARKIAVDAHLVWPGLTALVTIENSSCRQQNITDVCQSGDSFPSSSSNDDSDRESYDAGSSSTYAGSREPAHFGTFLSAVLIIVSFIIVAF